MVFLTFDESDFFADLQLDKSEYRLGDEVSVTIKDIQLNVDPTDIVPPLGINSIAQENLIIHGLYTDERVDEIVQQGAVHMVGCQLEPILICATNISHEVEGEFDYELSFQDETVNFHIFDDTAKMISLLAVQVFFLHMKNQSVFS